MKNLFLILVLTFSAQAYAKDFLGLVGEITNYTQLLNSELILKATYCKDTSGSMWPDIIGDSGSGRSCEDKTLASSKLTPNGKFELLPIKCNDCRNISVNLYQRVASSSQLKKLAHLKTNEFGGVSNFIVLKLNSSKQRVTTESGMSLAEWLKSEASIREVIVNYDFFTNDGSKTLFLEHRDVYKKINPTTPKSYSSPNSYVSIESKSGTLNNILVRVGVYVNEDTFTSGLSVNNLGRFVKMSETTLLQTPSILSIPSAIIKTQNFVNTLNGEYNVHILPLYKEGSFERFTHSSEREKASFNCNNGRLEGSLSVDRNQIQILNGVCDQKSAAFDITNLPLKKVDTDEIIYISGSAKAVRFTNNYVSVEICDSELDLCVNLSLFKQE